VLLGGKLLWHIDRHPRGGDRHEDHEPEASAQAEARLAEVQSSLDEVRRVLRAVEKVEGAAQKGRKVVSPSGGLCATEKLAEKAQRARRKTASHGVVRIEAIPVEE
jgi:hypothetical protein